MCDSRGSVSIFISIVPCLSLKASLAIGCGVTVMNSTRPSNLPSGTITIVPSCPRMRPGGSVAEPHLPIHEIGPVAVRSRGGIDRPVPLALVGVAVVRALAHQEPADHSVLHRLARLPPLVGAGGLGAHLQHAAGLLHSRGDALRFLDGMGDRLLQVHV